MDLEQATRFKDAPWIINEELPVVIGGAGGISSWLTLFLSRANINNNIKIYLYDFDKIEKVNIGGQFYRTSQIGQYKANAIKDLILDFSENEITSIIEKYDENSLRTPIMFAGFDNMAARKVMFENWCEEIKDFPSDIKIQPIFIDGRLLAENLQILCVTPDKIKEYKDTYLFKDEDVEEVACTLKQTSHVAAMIGSLMTNCFLNHIANCQENNKSRFIPFNYEYFLPLNIMTYVV